MGSALIESRPVGSTGLNLSRIGFGSAPIGDLKRAPSDETSRALLQQVWDAGIRYFDTAPFYGSGLSERRVGDFLRDKPRDSYVLSTKVGPAAGSRSGLGRKPLRQSARTPLPPGVRLFL